MIGAVIDIPYISVWLMLVLLLFILANNRRFQRVSMRSATLSYGIVLAILAVSILKNGMGNAGMYTIYFLVFGSAAFFLTIIPMDYGFVIRYSMGISAVYILAYFLLIRRGFLASEAYWSQQMGVAYAFVIPAVFSLAILQHGAVFGFGRKMRALAVAVFAVCVFIIAIDCGTRGAIVALMLACCLMFIGKLSAVKGMLVAAVIAVAAVVAVYNMDQFVYVLNGFLSSIGVQVRALGKMNSWLTLDIGLDNGRNELYDLARKVFKSSPVWGHGVGYFESVSNGTYVHNIFWQLMCEVGLIGTIVLLFFIAKDIARTFFGKDEMGREEVFCSIVFLVTVPLLMFSSTHWLLPSFWLYFGMLFVKKKKVVEVNGKCDRAGLYRSSNRADAGITQRASYRDGL